MKTFIRRIILYALFPLMIGITSNVSRQIYPLRVSENGRYFTDQKGTPVFWLGTTQWLIFRKFSTGDYRMILKNVKSKGFTAVCTMLVGTGDGTSPNLEGERPWLNNDPSTPNELYFKNVDSVVNIAAKYGLYVRLGILHNAQLKYMSDGKGKAYAIWVARRYKNNPNVFYSIHGNVSDPDIIAAVKEMAAGIEEVVGKDILISQKPDPSPKSSGIIQNEPWLDYTQSQTWKWVDSIYTFVTLDYNRKPVKPTVMDEGAYEAGSEYGFEVTPLWIRRQAYYTYLAGGHHTYGHNDIWRVLPNWRQALDAPGAFQLGVLKKVFLDRKEWWNLVPDQTIFASGGNTTGKVLNLAARHKDGQWIMVYLGSKATFSVKMDKITAGKRIKAFWINPKTGDSQAIGNFRNRGVKSFSTPDGWEDALLILEASSN